MRNSALSTVKMNAAKEKSDEISNKVGIQNEQLYIFII